MYLTLGTSPASGAPGTFALPGDGSQMLTLDSGDVDICCVTEPAGGGYGAPVAVPG